jgi:hypothetical protein
MACLFWLLLVLTDTSHAQDTLDDRAPALEASDRALRNEDERIRFDLTAGTTAPLHLGLQGVLELPYRIQLAAEIGWMPPGYLELINAVSTGAGWYDQTTASLVSAALENALVLRIAVGFRPFPSEGFEIRAGYTAAMLGGGLSAAEAIEAVTGRDPRAAGTEIPLQATAHGFQIDLSWAFFIERLVLVRFTVSYFQMVYAHTWIAVTPERGEMAVRAASEALDVYLNDVLSTYVKTPTLSVFIGYRFE